jgi:RNA ligase (TIGR02306 family)
LCKKGIDKIVRKLATIRTISELNQIPEADKIEVASIEGWKVVVRKGEYKVGDRVIYCEIDSFIPNSVAPFLTKSDQFPKEYQGVKGEKLRTIKLRGQVSQGLILPIPESLEGRKEGDDVSEELGIIKWEPPVDASLVGQVKGNFPSFLIKTDQERCQNLKRDIASYSASSELFEITEKLDGSSSTFFIRDGEFGVCSRNLELKEDESNTFWKVAREFELEEKLKTLNRNIAIQAELVGPKIQGNLYKLSKHLIFVFDVFDIDNYSYLSAESRYELIKSLDLPHVPIISSAATISSSTDELLQQAEGKSLLNKEAEREGLVFKSISNPNSSFKAISNKFLVKQK